jgi:tetratricopeptide (TPR) repeat protein
MLDCQIYGTDPKGHHLTNVALHICNSILLFLLLTALTQALWRSAFVAVLFALHPLHVESVAWIAERKDVLSNLFWILAMWSYLLYVRSPNVIRYLGMVIFFCLGLMAKPMVVTLPFVLLLIDYWPLCRFEFQVSGCKHLQKGGYRRLPVFRIVFEKMPLLALSGMSCLLTVLAQASGGAMKSLAEFPFSLRLENALVSYLSYVLKTFWPLPLAVLYPHPLEVSISKVLAASLFLLFVSVFAFLTRKSHPYFLVGWLWYLGVLVPTIGLVQVGVQAMADRYTYVSHIGLFIMTVWGISELSLKWQNRKVVLGMFAGVAFAVMIVLTWRQLGFWRDSASLFEHTLAVTENNFVMHNNLGKDLAQKGKLNLAQFHLDRALMIMPDYADAHSNMANVLAEKGEVERAMTHYYKALEIHPESSIIHFNLANSLMAQGIFGEAILHFREALRIDPNYAEAHNGLGMALAMQPMPDDLSGRRAGKVAGQDFARQSILESAVSHFRQAIRIMPNYSEAHHNLGLAFQMQGKDEEAIVEFQEALRINPASAESHYSLGSVFARRGSLDKAINHYEAALRINPRHSMARKNLERILKIKATSRETSR